MMEFVLAHRALAAFDAPACVSAFVTSRTVTVVAGTTLPLIARSPTMCNVD